MQEKKTIKRTVNPIEILRVVETQEFMVSWCDHPVIIFHLPNKDAWVWKTPLFELWCRELENRRVNEKT